MTDKGDRRHPMIEKILQQLGYAKSAQFLRGKDLEAVDGYAHVFRRATKRTGLLGVYTLRYCNDDRKGVVPLVYVCETKDDLLAREIHRQVWNQNVVPFLLVKSPRYLRLCKGFTYSRKTTNLKTDTLMSVSIETDQLFRTVDGILEMAISVEDIEQGRIWEKWGEQIRPDHRVDLTLLEELEKLGYWLTSHGMDIRTAHALIGKFVYLRYLRDRDILTDRKLQDWGIDPKQVFSRSATLTAFWAVDRQLDNWLNGAVFPIYRDDTRFRAEHIKKVAAIFFGDQVDGQLHLDFQAYDFSAIPTETLSSIYEQFLHATDPKTQANRGQESGAYYTPVPLVDFVVNEMERQKPLTQDTRVLDPSCGSGAFLVQCYRRMIEKKRSQNIGLTPHRLKTLLSDSIFGVELYEDACQVTALGLILTMLDNVTPPDLEVKRHKDFILPTLLNNNIFCADFFDQGSTWAQVAGNRRFDWIVGNPPWKEVKTDSEEEGDIHAGNWTDLPENVNHPVTDNQLAEAFAWKVRDYLSEDGVVGLVLPAMTLTKQNPRFRKEFFSKNRVHSVVNFANMRRVLFQKRKAEGASASSPAAVICFRATAPEPRDVILSYAPFIIDQVANRPNSARKKIPVWNIVVNSSDLQELPVSEVSDGSHLHWKIAMWGNPRDMKLLQRLQGRFETFEEYCQIHGLYAHEGFQLRKKSSNEELDYVSDLAGKNKLILNDLRGCGRVFEFPPKALGTIEEAECYVRKGRGTLPYRVSCPPHIILNASRRFAVYSDEFLAIPARQIGIGGTERSLLKALATYLSSDFVVYREFLDASEWGIRQDVSTLQSLRRLPIPPALSEAKTIAVWASLYDELKGASNSKRQDRLRELNARVYDALGLRRSEQILIEDMVTHRLRLLDGKVSMMLLSTPSLESIRSYVYEFQQVLDDFVGVQYKHEVVVYLCGQAAMLQIRLFPEKNRIEPQIIKGNSTLSDTLQSIYSRLQIKHSQWLYFDRCLKVYDRARSILHILKPLQMSQWTRSKALSDADDVIGESLTSQG